MKHERDDEGDRFLLAELQKGSNDAFRRLVDRYAGRLRAFAARRLRGTRVEPDDAVQETFLSLLKNLDRLGEIRSLEAYLFTILRRRIADLLRARDPAAAAAASLESLAEDAGLEPEGREGTPSVHARVEEARQASRIVLLDVLETVLSRLKSEGRLRDLKILELLFAAGKSQQETAVLAATSEPTVSRVRRALLEELAALARRHPLAGALEDLPRGEDLSGFVSRLWRANLLSCIKRSTLGSYVLGVLEPEWADYVKFHLETIRCEYCAAHLAELEEGEGLSEAARERIFQSSVGFLRK